MVLSEHYIDFEEERARLREQMVELAEEQAALEAKGKEEKAQQVLVQGNELNNQRNILETMAEEWGVDGLTLKGLSAGDVNRVEDTVEDSPGVRERDAWVAIGTVEAPYLAHDPDAVKPDEYADTVANVTDLPLPFVRWAEGRISEFSHLSEATGNGYIELVQDRQTD